MTSYKSASGGVIRLPGSAFIPDDPDNSDWQAYQEWLAEGNVPEPVAPMSPEVLRQHYTQVIQKHLDTTARKRNYDGILSLSTYATSTNATFAAEGQAGVEWRDAVWAKGYELLDEVEAGAREVPTEEELIALLPAMQWPSA